MPGEIFTNTESLANLILSAYNNYDGLVMETNLYIRNQHLEDVRSNFEAMEQTKEWITLQDPSKLGVTYGKDDKTQLFYAIVRGDNEWIKEKTSSGLNISTCSNTSIQEFLLLTTCNPVNEFAFNWLIEQGAKPEGSVLPAACLTKNINFLNALLNTKEADLCGFWGEIMQFNDSNTVYDVLNHAITAENIPAVYAFFKLCPTIARSIVTPDKAHFFSKVLKYAIEMNDSQIISELRNAGVVESLSAPEAESSETTNESSKPTAPVIIAESSAQASNIEEKNNDAEHDTSCLKAKEEQEIKKKELTKLNENLGTLLKKLETMKAKLDEIVGSRLYLENLPIRPPPFITFQMLCIMP